uniref:Leucine-rich repeat domain-containing protein n=1 Tax=viral metagenome TaxID=1070528 RepID=A0A6C0HEE5_9ZZZZ
MSIFYGSRLDLTHQPDLSLFTHTEKLHLDRNDIRVLYRELFPPNVKEINISMNRLLSDGLIEHWNDLIEILNLSDNQILDTFFVASWPINLKELYLDNNPLQVCPDNLPNYLETLSMNYCKLKHLYDLPDSIKILYLVYNKIKKMGKLPKSLLFCNLAHNYLTSHTLFSNPLPNLTYLNLSFNNLKWLPNHLPDSLETLIVNNNYLTALPKQLPKNLTMLSVCYNKIQDFTIDWKPRQRLKLLYIRDNCLVKDLTINTHIEKVYQTDNWNELMHVINAQVIQKAFKIYKLKKGIRNWRRFNLFYKELREVAMHPNFVNRWDQVETWNSWKH